MCQITSRAVADSYAIEVRQRDFATGGLRQDSNVRPNRLFTADSKLVLHQVGTLTATKVDQIVAKIIQIISA